MHPRERGGATTRIVFADTTRVYPRERREPEGEHGPDVPGRVYPASAGEPAAAAAGQINNGVYPRERGGAQLDYGRALFGEGLSPRARGSLSRRMRQRFAAGSIPASAGEPSGCVAG